MFLTEKLYYKNWK